MQARITHVTGACRSQSQMCRPCRHTALLYVPGLRTYPTRGCVLGCVNDVGDGLAQNMHKHARVRCKKQVQVATLSGMT